MDEFSLISRLSRRLARPSSPGVVGIGDDCAALPIASGGVQLLTCDIALEGRHFTLGTTPLKAVGWRVATASVSDVVACGGRPTACLVSLGVPAAMDPAGLDQLYDGLAWAADEYGFEVLGGNTSASDTLLVDLFMLGCAPAFVGRNGARPGDLVALTPGSGAAEAGRLLLAAGGDPAQTLIKAHLHPRARLDLAELVQREASAAIDVSDGLSSELHHLARASGVQLAVESAKIHLSPELMAFAENRREHPLQWVLNGGEGYQLLFTLPPQRHTALQGSDAVIIGEARAGEGVLLDGESLQPGGWNHLQPVKK